MKQWLEITDGKKALHSILQARHCERELPNALAELSAKLHEEVLPPLHTRSIY